MSTEDDAKDGLLAKALKIVVSELLAVAWPWLNEYFEVAPPSTYFEPYPSRWAKIATLFGGLVAALFFARLVWRATPATWPERRNAGLIGVISFLIGAACLLRYTFLIDVSYVSPPDAVEFPFVRLSLISWYAGGFGLMAFGIGTTLIAFLAQLPRKQKRAADTAASTSQR